ncbi:MAG: hypothetical protein U0412_11515 [Nitrospira sp.]
MALPGNDLYAAALDRRVQDVVFRERTLTFTALAARLHDCRWINLLRALHRLEKQHVIRLVPLPWDYQISGMPSAAPSLRAE